jgi:isocitrate/isopropylmalate dehydrogenase
VEIATGARVFTPDLGGTARTADVTKAVVDAVRAPYHH